MLMRNIVPARTALDCDTEANTLTLDFEFRSPVKIKDVGIYQVIAHPGTKLLCVAAEYRGYFGVFYDMAEIPGWFFDALADPTVTIAAHNATVERLCIQKICTPKFGWPKVPNHRFRCTAARVARLAIPRALEKAGAALGVDVVKDKEGTNVMRRLARPIKFTEQGPIYDESPEKLKRLGDYCGQDVKAEMAIEAATFPMPQSEEEFYQLTETINDRGVRVDVDLVRRLMWRAGECEDDLHAEMRRITKGAVRKYTEVAKLKDWIFDRTGTRLDTMRKEDMEGLLGGDESDVVGYAFPEDVKRAIRVRQEGAKTSVAKLKAILNRVSDDGRLRGSFVFNGASTGRYSSMGVQLQNLVRDTHKDFKTAIEGLDNFSLSDVSRTIRQCFIPDEGCVFIDADYSSVEARGVGWLAGAKKLLKVYRLDGDPYCEMGTAIYGFTVTKENEAERFVGKQTVLGCGYGMGPPKFWKQCVKFGQEVSEALAERAVKTYRTEYKEIPQLWYDMQDAAIAAVERPGFKFSIPNGLITFLVRDGFLQMKLPSGRRLFYKSPKIIQKIKFEREQDILTYWAENPITRQWNREETWGGKLTENAVQALCRDLLFEAMARIEARGVDIVLSVHDQLVCEVDARDAEWAKRVVKTEMERVPEWAYGFPIKAEPKIAERFGK